MEYLHNILFKLIEVIKLIFDDNLNIFSLIKILMILYIIYIVIINLYKLLVSLIKTSIKSSINKNIIYDNSLLKIYKLLKNKNFFSKKLVNDILKKIKKNDIVIEKIKEDRNIKLFKFINKKIQMKYKLSNENASNIIFYLYNLIKKLD
jgi:hypothetical protein